MKYLKLCSIILIVLLSFNCSCQTLKRKGTFGAYLNDTSDSKGIKIIKVIDNSTASSIGVLKDDIIKSINNIPFNDISDLVAYINNWRVDDQIDVLVLRNNKLIELKGKIQGKPYEQSKNGDVIYGDVDYDGGKLRSILILPKNVENPPIVFFLPGIGCGSLDYYYNDSAPIKLLIEGFVEQGIAVYRVEKPGMGDSQGTEKCLEMDFNYEVAAFNTALSKLKSLKNINKNKIYLYGHSLGSVTAPIIATKNKVAGIISWGGISTSWFEYMLKLEREQKVIFGTDYFEIDTNFRKATPFYIDLLINKKSPSELKKNQAYTDFLKYFQDDIWYGLHHYRYFQTLNDVNVLSTYITANCPVFTIAGEFDFHTVTTSWAKEIADAVNYYRPGQGSYIIIPKTSHNYHTVPSVEIYNKLRRENKIDDKYMHQHFNSDIPLIVAEWIKKTSPEE